MVPAGKRVLIVKFLGIGDVLFTTPMLRTLRRAWPTAHISYLTAPACAPILETNRNVDEVIAHRGNIKNMVKLARLAGRLRAARYDVVVNCHRSIGANIFAYLIGAPRRIGFDYRGSGFALTDKVSLTQNDFAPVLYMKLLSGITENDDGTALDLTLTSDDRNFASSALGGLRGANVAVAPGGGTNAWMDMSRKRWSLDGYVRLIDELLLRCNVVLLGGNEDKHISAKLRGRFGTRIVDYTGATTLRQAAAIIAKCSAFVGSDSSLLHLASAVRTPTVSLFGPTNPRYFAPRGPNDTVVTATRDLSCRPCFDYKKLPRCGDNVCMKSIGADAVARAVSRYI